MKSKTTKILAAIAVALASVFAAATVAHAAQTADSTAKPGWGLGDKNHTHTGPPGQSTHPPHGHPH